MEEQALVVVKESVITKLVNTLKKLFCRGKTKELLDDNAPDILYIENDEEFVQQEIIDARRAYRKYVINNNTDVSNEVLSYIIEKIEENQEKINQIIEINNNDITYQEIMDMITDEKKDVTKFKSKQSKSCRYSVPIGVIGIECADVSDSIRAMLKAISTRNSIIILHENYSKYSTESLILLIVKECLKNFYIDDSIIQMFEKEEIDLSKLDKVITKEEKPVEKSTTNSIYIYQEDDKFADEVKKEYERLTTSSPYKNYDIKLIKGEFGNIINYLNKNEASAVCMYTNNSQKAYKFINWINSPNVFVNTGVKNCKFSYNESDSYYNSKLVLHEDVF